MEIIEILNILEENKVFISLDGDDLDVSFDQEELSDEILVLLKENKVKLVEFLKKTQNKDAVQEIPVIPTAPNYELSSSQMRLWILSQFDNASLAYNMPFNIQLEGDYEIETLSKAIKEVINRHEILRTVFRLDNFNEVKMWIIPFSEFQFEPEIIDYSDFEDSRLLAEKDMYEDANTLFNLEKGPLLRVKFFKLNDNETIFYYNMHHIISDGWSMEVLSREVIYFYNSLKNNAQQSVKPLRIQYKDFASWQLNLLRSGKWSESSQFWVNKLAKPLPVFNLPVANKRPVEKTFSGHKLKYYLEKEKLDSLKDFSNRNSGSLFNTILSIWNILFYKFSSETELIVGTPYAGRFHSDLEEQIGFYVNTIVLRNGLNPSEKFIEFYKTVVKNTLEAITHQHYPFDVLLDEVRPSRDLSRNPIFDVMIALQNGSENKEDLNDYSQQLIDLGACNSKFDFEINHFEEQGYLVVQLEYNTDIYNIDIAKQLILGFESILNQALENPNLSLSNFSLLNDENQQKMIDNFNATYVDLEKNVTVIDLIEKQILSRPESPALVYLEEVYNYSELGLLINRFSNYLISHHNISSGDLVGLQLDRSSGLVIALLSVMKTGGCYVPLGVDYPVDRVESILSSSGIKKIIKQEDIDLFFDTMLDYSEVYKHTLRVDMPAYCIYTSGSTGVPKGVINTHEGLYNRLLWQQWYLGDDSNKVYLQKTPYTFDVSVWEFVLPFISGGTLVVSVPEGHKDPEYLKSCIADNSISITHFVPSMLGIFIDYVEQGELDSLRHIICSGEELPVSLVEKVRERLPQVRIHNLYGPTEASIDVTAIDVTDIDLTNGVTIGKPIWNTKVYIVDDQMNIQPMGVPGELLISGVQVSQGYLNLEDLTNDRFISDPFCEGARLYKTGDIAMWQEDGTIKYLGRKDNQVKLRGNRIELGEIESLLEKYPGVDQVVVSVKEVKEEKYLVSYLVLDTTAEIDKESLKKYLQGFVPDYMIPTYYVYLDSIPLTSSGKIDRKSLPDVNESDVIVKEFIAPRNETESKICSIWSDVLGIERVGVTDNFFDLGGHSLMVTQVINRMRRDLGLYVNFTKFFENPSIIGIQENLSDISVEKIPNYPQKSSYPVSPSQYRMWVLSQFSLGAKRSYNMNSAYILKGNYDESKLLICFKTLLARHEILRTGFKNDSEGAVLQFVKPLESIDFAINNLVCEKEEHLPAILEQLGDYDFDFTNPPLIRLSVIKQFDDTCILHLNMHHIISDGWSMQILMSEFVTLYNQLLDGLNAVLPNLEIQYKDYTLWSLEEQKKLKYLESEKYWLNKFSGEIPKLELPTYRSRPLTQTNNGNQFNKIYSKTFLASLQDYAKTKDVTLFMVLMSGIKTLFNRYSSQTDIIIGTPIAGRSLPELEPQIGLYLNTLAIRSEISGAYTFDDVLNNEKQSLLEAYEHQEYSFDELVGKLNLSRDISRSSLFDVMVVLQNQSNLNINSSSKTQSLEIIPYNLEQKYSKFDLSFTFIETEGGLNLSINYNSDIYEAEFVETIFSHLEILLTKCIKEDTISIGLIDYLSQQEKETVLLNFNETYKKYDGLLNLVTEFERNVSENENSPCLMYQQNEYTFKEINDTSNALAHYLLDKYEIRKEDFICVRLPKNEKSIIAIMGILKVGGAYVPIDVDYPTDRIDYIVKDSNARIVIDESFMNEFESEKDKYSVSNPLINRNENDLAYMIYTSGTTGYPKGVVIEHKGVVNLIKHQTEYFDLKVNEQILLFSSLSFDASVEQIFLSLLNKSTLHIIDSSIQKDMLKLENYIDERGITHLHTTPSVLEQIVSKKYTNLLRVISGGEACPESLALKWKDYCDFYNEYGPTETTITTIEHKYNEKRPFVIGKPISNSQVYILNEFQQICPIGVFGKMYIGGLGLSRGYWQRDELNRSQFINHPFRENEKLYNTGDIGRWLPEGILEFKGREDQQVKIRGYRIELQEIEQVIRRVSLNLSQVVVDCKEINQGKVLVAYFVKQNKQEEFPSNLEIKSYLQDKLPDYMIPSFYVELDQIPFTPNGKLDRKNLPALTGENTARNQYVGPRNSIEAQLVKIWQEVLGVEKVGVTDNFFEIGGNSLMVVRLINRLSSEFDVAISIGQFFMYPTIEKLAKVFMDETVDFDSNDDESKEFDSVVL